MQSFVPHTVLYPPCTNNSSPTTPLSTTSACTFPPQSHQQQRSSSWRRRRLGRHAPTDCPLHSSVVQASAKPFYVQQRGDEEEDLQGGVRGGGRSTTLASPRQKSWGNTVYVDQLEEARATLSPRAKTLKINIDLILWRSRQSRLAARLTLDAEKRKSLMRSAEDGLRRCLDLDPGDGRTYVVLGKLLTMNKRYDEARKLYTEGCQNTGNTNPFIWSAWGWLEFKTANIERARKLFDAATVVSPTHAAAWHKWGFMEKCEGKYGRARDLWLKGISLCKQQGSMKVAYLYNALACMSAQLGNVREARFWFKEGTSELSGKNSTALWQAWCVLEAREKELPPNQMRQMFRKAVECNPRSRYVHLGWALWEREQGNLELCIALQRRGLQFNPTDAALYSHLAIVMWRDCGDVVAARDLFEGGVRADPGDLYVWQAWGYMEGFVVGNVDRARQLFQEGVWADPRSPSTAVVLQAWGMLERKNKNYQLARELFKAAVKVDPKNEAVWGSWITMERDLGFTERADELEIKLNENRWEFEVPAGFTTRVDSSPVTALARMSDMLRRFFTIRGDGKGSASRENAGAPSTPSYAARSMSTDGSAAPNNNSTYAAELGASELFNSGGDSNMTESGVRGFSSRSNSQKLQLDDVLPRSVQEAQTGELQQLQQQQQQREQQGLASSSSFKTASQGQQQTPQSSAQPSSAAPGRKTPKELSQPLRAPAPAAQSSSTPPGISSSVQPRAPSPQHLLQHQPAHEASIVSSSRSPSPPPPTTPAANETEPGPRASPPPPPRTTTTSIGSSKLGLPSRSRLGVGKVGAGVARPVRDAALTAAGREVEKPLEMALQDLLLDEGSSGSSASRSGSSSDNGSDSSDGEGGGGSGARVVSGDGVESMGERLAGGPSMPDVGGSKASSNGSGARRGSNGTEAWSKESRSGSSSSSSSSSKASPDLGSGSQDVGGQQQKSVGQQLLELVGEESRDTEFRE